MKILDVGVIPLNVLALLLALRARSKAVRVGFAGTAVSSKILALAVSFALLGSTSVLADDSPVFMLPTPTGDHAVGVEYFALVDENRTDPFLEGSTHKRKLMVKVYYPGVPDDAKPYSRYFRGSSELLQAFGDFYQLPRFALDHLGLVETHAKEGLELSDAEPSYPVVLFSHGAGTTMEVHTSQGEDLASHGYIVVAIDHTYVSAATAFPDHVATASQATTNFDTPEPAAPITRIMADDAAFVIEKLGEMNDGGINAAFTGRLNLDEIGVIGHSVGGAVAYDLAIRDPRVKAAINLDGAVYVVPTSPTAVAPFLMVANDEYHAQAIERRESLLEAIARDPNGPSEPNEGDGGTEANNEATDGARETVAGLADVLAASGNLYTVSGCGHMEYSDVGLFVGSTPLREFLRIGGRTDPARCLEITQALTVAFFDHHLKGRAVGSLESLAETLPELKRVDLR